MIATFSALISPIIQSIDFISKRQERRDNKLIQEREIRYHNALLAKTELEIRRLFDKGLIDALTLLRSPKSIERVIGIDRLAHCADENPTQNQHIVTVICDALSSEENRSDYLVQREVLQQIAFRTRPKSSEDNDLSQNSWIQCEFEFRNVEFQEEALFEDMEASKLSFVGCKFKSLFTVFNTKIDNSFELRDSKFYNVAMISNSRFGNLKAKNNEFNKSTFFSTISFEDNFSFKQNQAHMACSTFSSISGTGTLSMVENNFETLQMYDILAREGIEIVKSTIWGMMLMRGVRSGGRTSISNTSTFNIIAIHGCKFPFFELDNNAILGGVYMVQSDLHTTSGFQQLKNCNTVALHHVVIREIDAEIVVPLIFTNGVAGHGSLENIAKFKKWGMDKIPDSAVTITL
ncbi:hypothetical protein L8V23_10115 [Corynebacterium sp. c6VSa_13]|uniref:hypothetical protein n=1 Tax=Corynebacterium sp. c6VSa_13 TaxID=2913496 RepID=UPI0022BA307C|nr:hypothetical protein [Corynebacterium sp. c6VSa_13]MCZ9310107.1 hypothetical protein [Corynebacterium sp. c6VSa_13]